MGNGFEQRNFLQRNIGAGVEPTRPQQMQACFLSWIEAISQQSGGEIIAIDGKTVRHSR